MSEHGLRMIADVYPWMIADHNDHLPLEQGQMLQKIKTGIELEIGLSEREEGMFAMSLPGEENPSVTVGPHELIRFLRSAVNHHKIGRLMRHMLYEGTVVLSEPTSRVERGIK
ncbi:MAG TPA: hypothetical protein VLE91_01265 [Candidatus Saccharimonadales bacterium]|nr:hypothetical protein [Candidatus Saccharimonadales bacterium]